MEKKRAGGVEIFVAFSKCKGVNMGEQKVAYSIDPWEHRSERMKCVTCMWFVEKKTQMGRLPGRVIGRCRRHAPTMGGYPVVYSGDWCGDHKVDEGKP